MEPYAGVDTTRLLMAGMRVAQLNHRLIANNIANVDTPGYNPVTIDFQATLRDALDGRGSISLRKTRPQHIERNRLNPFLESLAYISKNDYNKVDIDQEIAKLSKNTGRYNVYGSLLVKRFQMVTNMLSAAR